VNFCANCGSAVVGPFCGSCGAPTGRAQGQVPPPPAAQPTMPPYAAPAPVQPPMPPYAPPAGQPPLMQPPASQPFGYQQPPVAYQAPVRAPKPPRKPLGKKAIIGIAAGLVVALIGVGLIVREYVLPFSGTLAVRVDNQSTSNNPLIPGHLTIQVGEENLRLPTSRGSNLVLETTWSSSESISAKIDSKFTLEKDTFLFVNVRDFGLSGSSAGTALNLNIKITDTAITMSLENPSRADEGSSDLAAVAFARSNLKGAIESCYLKNAEPYSRAIRLASNAYRDYLTEVEDARLDGTRSLQYTVWASRSSTLVRELRGIKSALDSARVPGSGPINNEHGNVSLALGNVISAWENFNSVSRRESDSQWDAAWNRIYDAESNLTTAAGGARVLPEVVRSDCREDLLGG